MLGFIKKLFGVLGAILKLPLTLLSLPAKLLSGKKGKSQEKTADAAPKTQPNEAFFLAETEATGVPATAPKKTKKTKAKKSAPKAAEPATPAAATVASTLNLPQPTVTTPAPANNYTKFGARRRPGANMKSYLDMAKNIKNA